MLFTLFTILLAVFLIMVFVTEALNTRGYYISDAYYAVTITVGIITIISLVFVIIETPKRPTAIDVYRGKTTLEITYKDGVAIDSTVVFNVK